MAVSLGQIKGRPFACAAGACTELALRLKYQKARSPSHHASRFEVRPEP